MADNVTVKDASESNVVMRATDNASVYTPHTIVDSGTVTANLGATDNAVLDSIDAACTAIQTAVETLDNIVSGSEAQVDVLTLPADPLGANADAAATAGGAGSISAKLRHISSAIDSVKTAVEGTVTVDGSGVTQPVSGTVTANLSATDNAVLDTIDAVLDAINAKLAGGTVIGDVNLGATDNAVLDAIAASLASMDDDPATETTLAACLTALQLIDNAISGNEMQVDIVGALPAGTNAIGKLAANSGVDIGDVDVTSLPGNVQNALTGEYETVAASQTAQVIGATGGTGDFIAGVLIVPATTSPGNVLLLDNATSITIFTGGADSVSNLVPFYVPLNLVSTSGAWKLTTGANVSAIASGNFT